MRFLRRKIMKRTNSVILFAILAAFCITAAAQATEFTYQGQMTTSGSPATGNHDFEFALFDAVSGGTQVGSTIGLTGIAVTNGIFSAKLDFGNQFPGAGRFLEIRVRPTGSGAFTTLTPRQAINSSPYSVKSLNSNTADTANTATTAANISNPLAGDVTGIQSNTSVVRLRGRTVASTLPNNGQVLKFNATNSQWEPANDETATPGSGGTITGVTAGTGLTGGGTTGSVSLAIANAGVGTTQVADGAVTAAKIPVGQVVKSINTLRDNVTLAAGSNITITPAGNTLTIAATGGGNPILNQTTQQTGANFNIDGTGTADILNAGTQFNLRGQRVLFDGGVVGNLFVGIASGANNSTGGNNSYFGFNTGTQNTVSSNNSFFGAAVGGSNTGSGNSFFGSTAGQFNTTGVRNVFFGAGAGQLNITGNGNTLIGTFTTATNLENATAIGNRAIATQNNTLILGGISGLNGCTLGNNCDNVNVGIGTTNPGSKLTVAGVVESSSGGFKFPDGSTQLTAATGGGGGTITGVTAGTGLTGGGTTGAVTVGIAASGVGSNELAASAVTNAKIASNAVTATKIATGEVVKSINSLKDNVTLAAGTNITITPSGSTLTIASTGGGGIQNQTTLQNGANFNIDGAGTANILSATTQFNLGPNRILSNAGVDNLFVGWGAGAVNTGTVNSFFGRDAGAANTNGLGNSFFGANAGESNTSASSNSFFGSASGRSNTTGTENSFFGFAAGNANATGNNNAFFGANAGLANTIGNNNVFLGSDAGRANTTGASNVFIGAATGFSNTLGGGNAFFGRSTGYSNTTGRDNAFFGTEAGLDSTTGGNNAFFGWRAGRSNVTGSFNTSIGDSADVNSGNLQNATAIGAGAIVGASNRVQLGRDGLDTVRVGTLGNAVATNLCISNNNVLAACTSSGKYKKNVQPLSGGLNLVNKLRPVTFDWKDRDEQDIGLIAEEVAKADPLLVTRDRNGNIQGVKYDQLSAVLIKAMKEQQAMIDSLKLQIRSLISEVRKIKKKR